MQKKKAQHEKMEPGKVQHVNSATGEERKREKRQHENAKKEYHSLHENKMKEVQHEKCNMKKVQHEKSVTGEKCNRKNSAT